jgi:hypothetical protein
MIKIRPEPQDARTPGQREDDALLLVSEFTEDLRMGCGLPEGQAHDVARKLVERLRLRHGARRIYIPGVDKSQRDAAIRAQFNGRNAGDVCREFNISRARLYQLVRRPLPV